MSSHSSAICRTVTALLKRCPLPAPRIVHRYTTTSEVVSVDGRLPFGIRVREDMKLAEVDDAHCRVNYNCDFTLPTGLRGAILGRVFGRSFDTGPANSLSRLKREAERVSESKNA